MTPEHQEQWMQPKAGALPASVMTQLWGQGQDQEKKKQTKQTLQAAAEKTGITVTGSSARAEVSVVPRILF